MEMTLTKNFWVNVRTLLFANGNTVGYLETSSSNALNAYSLHTIGDLKDVNGNTQNLIAGDSGQYTYAYAMSLFAFSNTGSYGSYFAVGSGTTPATPDDINIEQSIANATVKVTGQNSANGSVTYHVTVTATDDISVGEICLFKRLTTRVTSGTDYNVLIGRCAFTPIDLVNGQSKTFDITISLPIPA